MGDYNKYAVLDKKPHTEKYTMYPYYNKSEQSSQ